MNHPEVFIIPIMMLADYFLTVWGAILSERKYRQHFKIESYELNPIWQKSIAQKKWFNLRHLGIVLVITCFCCIWSNAWKDPDPFSEGLFGFFAVFYASVIANHLSNILIFSYLNRHPESTSGEVKTSHLFALKTTQFHIVSLFFILTVIAVFSHTPFIIGAACSQISRFLTRSIWIAKARAAEKKKIPPIISR